MNKRTTGSSKRRYRLPGVRCVILPEGVELADLMTARQSRAGVTLGPATQSTSRFYDSFDSPLYRAGKALAVQADAGNFQLPLDHLTDGTPEQACSVPAIPRFSKDLPPGPTRDALAAILDPRVLLAVVELEALTSQHLVLDGEGKTVVRLAVEEQRLARDPDSGETAALLTCLRVLPLRGYQKAHRNLCARLCDDLGCTQDTEHPMLEALQALGKQAGSYTARLDIQLESGG